MNADAAKKPTVLIAEDQPVLSAWIRVLLENNGYEVLEASSGLAALDLWKESNVKADLLLTDMIMPDGISGQQLAERLTGSHPNLKVIFTSGYRTDVMGPGVVLQEGVNFLEKPYSPQKLLEIVNKALKPGVSPQE